MVFRYISVAILVTTLICVENIVGFEVDTHRLISEKATENSQLNNFLSTVLHFDFPQGTLEPFERGRVVDLIARIGAVDEDKPGIRSRTHFHDPTKAWSQAGLQILFGNFESAVLWSQNADQGITGKHSWQDARNSYFNALTATSVADRKKYYAETFVSLGHLIHLVQDAAAPSHTRNDWHIGIAGVNDLFPFLNVDTFHAWAKKYGEPAIETAASQSQPFDAAILNQTYNGLVPIAGIIDTTTAAGQATPSAATNIGIAEFSNANFFSDDTILKDYAYPSAAQMQLTEEAGPDGPPTRFYLRKNLGPGPTGYRAAVATLLDPYLPPGSSTPRQWDLDNHVMADYGERLFPRAIGYSAGLIDYFFRAEIDNGIQNNAWEVQAYSWEPEPRSIPVEKVKINVSGGEQQTGTGSIRLVLIHWDAITTEGHTNSIIPTPEVVVSDEVPFTISSVYQSVTFPFASLPFPNAVPPPEHGYYYIHYYLGLLVYKGTIGQETNIAVAAGGYCDFSGERFERFYLFQRSADEVVAGEC